jgi:hypothetical protein
MESSLPRWSVRLDAFRPAVNPGFSDLISLVNHHFRLHSQADAFLGPYNAKQRGSKLPYIAPTKEQLKAVIRQGSINDFTYMAFINSLVKFCEQTKGLRSLPKPHPSVIHSIQLPLPAFSIETSGSNDTVIHITHIQTPLIVKGLRQPEQFPFIIVRPKLSQLGTPSANKWEVLFFKQWLGYIPDWADTQLNPRYAGIYA